jgi:hypothetical protein
MRTASATATIGSNGDVSDPIILDTSCSHFSVGAVMVEVVDGATAKLQYSYDNPQVAAASRTWLDHASATGKTATFDVGALAAPCTMVRLNLTAGSAGSFRLDVCQYG